MQITTGKVARAQKIVIYGPEGIGKSTFASRFPDPLFIDTEGSTYHMDVARTPKPSSWTLLMDQVKYFKMNPTKCNTLVLDTADWAERLCITQLCANSNKDGIEGFGYGKGYTYLAEEFGRLLNLLEEVVEQGINVVVTAHAQMRKFEQPDEMGAYDRWELKLQKKTAPLLKEWADMVLFTNYKTHVINVDGQGTQKGKNKVQGGKRIMYTTHHPCWDAKNRHDLPPELDLDYGQIQHCIVTRGTAITPEVKPAQTKSEPKQGTELATEIQKLEQQQQRLEQKIETKPAPRQEAVQQTTIPLDDIPDKWPDPLEGLPKQLVDLMQANSVTAEEIQKAVGSKGYYPADTPISNYDPGFIDGVLVGAWGQVFDIIKNIKNNEVPF